MANTTAPMMMANIGGIPTNMGGMATVINPMANMGVMSMGGNMVMNQANGGTNNGTTPVIATINPVMMASMNGINGQLFSQMSQMQMLQRNNLNNARNMHVQPNFKG